METAMPQTKISLVKRGNRTERAARILEHIFAVQWREITKFEILTSTLEYKCKPFIPCLYSETARTHLF